MGDLQSGGQKELGDPQKGGEKEGCIGDPKNRVGSEGGAWKTPKIGEEGSWETSRSVGGSTWGNLGDPPEWGRERGMARRPPKWGDGEGGT